MEVKSIYRGFLKYSFNQMIGPLMTKIVPKNLDNGTSNM